MLWFWGLTEEERRAYIPPVGRVRERTRPRPESVETSRGEAAESAARGPGRRYSARALAAIVTTPQPTTGNTHAVRATPQTRDTPQR
jgi:hypothetical protein